MLRCEGRAVKLKGCRGVCADWASPSAWSFAAMNAEPSSPDTEGVTPVGVLTPLVGSPPLQTENLG